MEDVFKKLSCPFLKQDDKRVNWKNFNCSYFKFNSLHFWAYLKQKKQSNFSFKAAQQLINEKTIILNNDEKLKSQSVLCIGLNPEDKFKIYARLENHNPNTCFMLTLEELKTLLKLLADQSDDIFSNEKPIQIANIGKRLVIHENVLNCAEIVSYDDGRRISLDKASIKRLLCMRKFITRFIFLLNKEVVKSEKLFLWLLHNFCLGKTFNEACESAWTNIKYNFFDGFANVKCDCTEENFTLEIATKCEYWFGLCVPLFLRTLMLIESERLASFKVKWPHYWAHVSIEEMAKCGLYYTGIGDNVKCAFCNVMLHKWEFGDKPINEHYKFSPKCPFLYDFRKTSNVSDIGEIGEIDKLIAGLPTARGIDEID